MKRALLLTVLACTSAWAQFTTVTSSKIYNGGQTLLSSGKIVFTPSVSYRAGGGGQVITLPVTCSVSNGVITQPCRVADTSASSPVNVCFSVTVKNSQNQTVLGTPVSTGYECVQPAANNYWCISGSCNFDNFIPNWTSNLWLYGVLGPLTPGDCIKSADEVHVTDAGNPCGTGTGSGTSGPNYGSSFTSQTSITIAGTSHNLGTKNLIVACYDTASPANRIEPSSYTVNGSTFDVIVNFATAQSGYCVVNGSGPAVYSTAEASATSWSIPAATHGLGSSLQVRAYDGSGNQLDPANVNVDGSGNVTVSWAIAQSGKVVITQ